MTQHHVCSEAEARLARLTAQVDQALAIAADAARANLANRQLVDLALDMRNTLAPPAGRVR